VVASDAGSLGRFDTIAFFAPAQGQHPCTAAAPLGTDVPHEQAAVNRQGCATSGQSTTTERAAAQPPETAIRVGVIADAHANLPATAAILEALTHRHCTTIIHVGDAIGIGPHPGEVLSLLIEREVVCVMGNHDEWFAFGLAAPHADRMSKDELSINAGHTHSCRAHSERWYVPGPTAWRCGPVKCQ
jgi:hypothetical protein